MQTIDNQQECDFNEKQLQVLISGFFGDGCFTIESSGNTVFSTNSIHKKYLEYKIELLGNNMIRSAGITSILNKGYKESTIYVFSTKSSCKTTKIKTLPIEEKLKLFTNLGIALWFYDDGSLHKKNHFYNLCTHAFSKEIQEDVFVPFFKDKLGILPKVLKEVKSDGRVFNYLYFGKHYGAFEIAKILQTYPIDCFSYKAWSSETIQEWSKLKVELKSKGIENITPAKFSNLLKGYGKI